MEQLFCGTQLPWNLCAKYYPLLPSPPAQLSVQPVGTTYSSQVRARAANSSVPESPLALHSFPDTISTEERAGSKGIPTQVLLHLSIYTSDISLMQSHSVGLQYLNLSSVKHLQQHYDASSSNTCSVKSPPVTVMDIAENKLMEFTVKL